MLLSSAVSFSIAQLFGGGGLPLFPENLETGVSGNAKSFQQKIGEKAKRWGKVVGFFLSGNIGISKQ